MAKVAKNARKVKAIALLFFRFSPLFFRFSPLKMDEKLSVQQVGIPSSLLLFVKIEKLAIKKV